MDKPRILFISCGGTIASKVQPGFGYNACLTSEDLLAHCPDNIRERFEVDTWQYGNVLGYSLTPDDIVNIVRGIKDRFSKGNYVGAVVTQGTASIDETSYMADLMWDDPRPLVFTGAMKNGSDPGWDGPSNVLGSVLIAICPEARDKGVMIYLGGEIHAARDAFKAHKTSYTPLISFNGGPLGYVINQDQVVFHRSPALRHTFEIDKLEKEVEIIKISIGCSGKLIEAAISTGTKAIVLEAFPGSGGVTPEAFEVIKKYANEGYPFVLAPRSPIGSYLSLSAGGCGPWSLRQEGVLYGGDLMSIKLRLLLMAVLPTIKNNEELKALLEKVSP